MEGTSIKYDDPQVVKLACSAFNIDHTKAKLIRYYSNLVYDCGDTILRLTHAKHNSEEGIIGEVTFMRFLQEKGLPVVKVILSKTGKLTKRIPLQTGYLTAVCFKKIIGHKVNKEIWNDEHFEELGILTGKLHKYSILYQKESKLNYPSWYQIAKSKIAENLPRDGQQLLKLHQQLVAEFHNYSMTTANYGLIHFDIHFGNYLFRESDGQLTLFDFEMLCNNWFINDIAVVLYYALYLTGNKKPIDFQAYFLQHFWKGYEQVHTIAQSEKEKIPKFLLYRDLLVYSFLHKIWAGKELTKQDIQYKKKLEKSIHTRRTIIG